MSALMCEETLVEMPLKSAALRLEPASLLHRTIHRRLTQGQVTAGCRARRRLFSAVDADEVSRFVKRELATIRAADRRRYNFDFDKMQPLKGRFQWERVGDVRSPCENTPAPLHRSARRLELDCPRAATASGDYQQGLVEDIDRAKSASLHVACPGEQRICFPMTVDASSKTLKETSQPGCDHSQDSCLRSRTASERLTGSQPRQTALTDLWQTRKRSSVWNSTGSQPKKPSAGSAPRQDTTPGDTSEEERPAAHSRQALLRRLKGLDGVSS